MSDTPIRVLVVDDEPALREPLADYLVRQGFVVTQAGTAAEARSRLNEAGCDIVLLDIMMPGEDGLSLCRHLVEARKLPVIFITAFPERLLTGERPEPAFLVTKPFNPDMVKALISQALFFGTSRPLN